MGNIDYLSDVQQKLAELHYGWSKVYRLTAREITGGIRWSAERHDGKGILEAPDPETLRRKIWDDHAAHPPERSGEAVSDE